MKLGLVLLLGKAASYILFYLFANFSVKKHHYYQIEKLNQSRKVKDCCKNENLLIRTTTEAIKVKDQHSCRKEALDNWHSYRKASNQQIFFILALDKCWTFWHVLSKVAISHCCKQNKPKRVDHSQNRIINLNTTGSKLSHFANSKLAKP